METFVANHPLSLSERWPPWAQEFSQNLNRVHQEHEPKKVEQRDGILDRLFRSPAFFNLANLPTNDYVGLVIIACLEDFVRCDGQIWVQKGYLKAIVQPSIDGSKETTRVKKASRLKQKRSRKSAFH